MMNVYTISLGLYFLVSSARLILSFSLLLKVDDRKKILRKAVLCFLKQYYSIALRLTVMLIKHTFLGL